ncbi:hypothetical protein HHI36_000922 [Cryptolaemus montrouzieri]|uniref:Uncharacterized protein n=1 Tax=Cryptolaemus montrouzieri TaxID=559131 RepID=A0ABD2P6A1_9CUCU
MRIYWIQLVYSQVEVIKYVNAYSTDECVVLPEEVCEGVFTGSVVAKPNEHGIIPIRFLKVNEKHIVLRNFEPKLEQASNFKFYKFENMPISVNRVENVLKSVNIDATSEEEKNQ